MPGGPPRIVSLVPSLTETLWALGFAEQVVGRTQYCVSPPEAFARAREVRGTKNPDVAAIRELAPDLVLADREENRELDVRRLREAGLEVHVTGVRSVSDVARELERLGAVLGVPAAAERLAIEVWTALDRALPARPALRAVCPVWWDGQARWWLLGRDTYAGDLLRVAGFDTWPDDPASRYPQELTEAVRACCPDVVLLPDEPYAFTPGDAASVVRTGTQVRHVHGQALLWWGPRTPGAIADLAALARGLQGQ